MRGGEFQEGTQKIFELRGYLEEGFKWLSKLNCTFLHLFIEYWSFLDRLERDEILPRHVDFVLL